MPGEFETQFISTADKPALIAFSTPDFLDAVKGALNDLGYKVHAAVTHSDFLERFSQIVTRLSSSRSNSPQTAWMKTTP